MEPFLGQISIFAFGLTPRGWAPCNGQLLNIHQNQALFALLGTTYGGNGVTTFALPNLNGRVPLHPSQNIRIGVSGGTEVHALTIAEMPEHTHTVNASTKANSASPENNVWAKLTKSPPANRYSDQINSFMNVAAISEEGNGQAHNNMQPYAVANYCIALQGIFPSRH